MRIFLFLFLSFWAVVSAEAQQVASYFVSMPAALLPQIDTNRRKDMLDYYRESQQSVVSNLFGGESSLLSLSDDYLAVSLSSKSTMQIKLLPLRGGETQLIAVVNTVCAPACDSRIDFYDTDWQPLKRETYFPVPDDADFLSEYFKNEEPVLEAVRKIDISLMQYCFSAENTTLRVYSTFEDYMPEEISETIKPFVKKWIEYVWDGRRFSKRKLL